MPAKTAKDHSKYIAEEFGSLVGKTVVKVRQMTQDECDQFMWDARYGEVPIVLELNDGSFVVPSQDPEGNGAGFLFVITAEEWMA